MWKDSTDIIESRRRGETFSTILTKDPELELEIEILGLTSRKGKKMNGRYGFISQKNFKADRWVVTVNGEQCLLKEENIQLSPRQKHILNREKKMQSQIDTLKAELRGLSEHFALTLNASDDTPLFNVTTTLDEFDTPEVVDPKRSPRSNGSLGGEKFPKLLGVGSESVLHEGRVVSVVLGNKGEFYDGIVIHDGDHMNAVILDSEKALAANVAGMVVKLREMPSEVSELVTKKVLLNTPSIASEFFENSANDRSNKIASNFFYADLTRSQMIKHQNVFRDVPSEIKQTILERTMQERRIDAIAKFCNIDHETSKYYLEEYDYNPEPVIAEIDQMKRKKYDLLWMASYAAVFIAIIYYVIIRSFVNDYLKNYDKSVWEISYVSSEDYPHPLPVIVLPVKGILSSRITPFEISLKYRDNATSSWNTERYCSPKPFIEDCWGNEANELTCSDGESKNTNDPAFTWAMCRKKANVTRKFCPRSDPIMCGNLKANMGVEPACENHEMCAVSILGGPRPCKDGRDLASLHDNPTSCNVTEVFNDTKINYELQDGPQIYRYETNIIIMPPHPKKARLKTTQDQYYVSFRFNISRGQSENRTEYAMLYQTYDSSELNLKHNITTFNELQKFFYSNPDRDIKEIHAGSLLDVLINPVIIYDKNGERQDSPTFINSLISSKYMWYHSAVQYKLISDRVSVNEQKHAVDFMNDFLGPAGGFICLLLQVQSVILLIALTGFHLPDWIPCETCRSAHFFGWKINDFTEEFRIKLVLFQGIFNKDLADGDEGNEMLKARAVQWPTNRKSRRKGSVMELMELRNERCTRRFIHPSDTMEVNLIPPGSSISGRSARNSESYRL